MEILNWNINPIKFTTGFAWTRNKRLQQFASKRKCKPLRQEKRPVHEGVKNFVIKWAQKYLKENGICFYQFLQSVDNENNVSDNDD